MNNFLVLDESKLSDGSLYCFAGVLFKDVETFFQSEAEFIVIKNKYDSLSKSNIELKGRKIGSSLSVYKRNLITDLIGKVREKVVKSEVKVFFILMHKDDLSINDTNVVDVVKKLLETHTNINKEDIQKYIYNELSAFLIYGLSGLTFPDEYLQYILCDNIYGLDEKNEQQILTEGNITITQNAFSSVIANIIEITHNQISKRKHIGLKSIDFSDSNNFISIQVCDILSNFIVSSIRYLFYTSINDISKAKKYKLKYDILNNNLFSINLPINEIPLAESQTDITCTTKFPIRLGHL